MTNYPISDISEAEDIETINMYNERIAQGYAKEDIIASINAKGRDNARTPMQWDDSENGGFTTGTPWLHVNPNYKTINVKAELADPDSIFYTYKKLIELRKQNEIVVWGSYHLLEETADEVFAYIRELDGERWLVVTNISEENNTFEMPSDGKEVIISNYEGSNRLSGEVELKPYEAFVVKI